MRRLSVALTGLAVAGVVLVPVSADAVAAPSEFHIGIVADEGPAPAAGTVFGHQARLVSGGVDAPVAGAPVRLMVRPAGQSGFTVARTVTTDGDGYASASVKLVRTTAYRWEFAGTEDHAAATSPVLVDAVGSRVGVSQPKGPIRRGAKVVVTGTTYPAQPGKRVSLWKGDKPAFAPDLEMTRLAVGTVRADGSYRLVVRFARSGPKRLYVKVAAGGGNAAGYSRYVRIRVR